MTAYHHIPSREQHLGKRLHQLRTQHGLTLEQVADRYGLPIAILARLESGDAIPGPLVSNMRAALKDLDDAPRPVIIDGASRPAELPEPEKPQTRGGYSIELRDDDRALLEQLAPERARRGLRPSQAAAQIGLTPGGYKSLELVKSRRLEAKTRAKLQAWLAHPPLELVCDEPLATPEPADPTAATRLSDVTAGTTDTPKGITFAPRAPVGATAALAKLPLFDAAWPEAVQLRWFDSFDQLAAMLAATEVLP